MKQYSFIKTSTAGNRTGFIIGENAWQNRKFIMSKLLIGKNMEAEQYAFLWRDQNNNCVMNMAGGELCGGAILASPTILNNTIRTNIYTLGKQLQTTITDKGNKQIRVKTSLPRNILKSKPIKKTIIINNQINSGYMVDLTDIAYFVTQQSFNNYDKKTFTQLDQQLKTQSVPAIGIILVDKIGKIKPIVWVKSVNTIVEEMGCTTGTIAAQAVFAKKDSLWLQPSQKYISSQITNQSLDIESDIEILSEGTLYLN